MLMLDEDLIRGVEGRRRQLNNQPQEHVLIRMAECLVGRLPRRSPRRANRCDKNRAIRKRTNNSHGKGKEPAFDGRTKEQSDGDRKVRSVRDLEKRRESCKAQSPRELGIHLESTEND